MPLKSDTKIRINIVAHRGHPSSVEEIVFWFTTRYWVRNPHQAGWHYHAQTLQGHLTNTKESRVNSDAAQVLAGCPVKYCLQLPSKGRQWLFISDGRRRRVPGTGSCNWKCTFRHRVAGVISVNVAADCRRLQELRQVVRYKVEPLTLYDTQHYCINWLNFILLIKFTTGW